jgi:hypothetical protein
LSTDGGHPHEKTTVNEREIYQPIINVGMARAFIRPDGLYHVVTESNSAGNYFLLKTRLISQRS